MHSALSPASLLLLILSLNMALSGCESASTTRITPYDARHHMAAAQYTPPYVSGEPAIKLGTVNLWDAKLQKKLNTILLNAPKESVDDFYIQNTHYRWQSSGKIYHHPTWFTPCRRGILQVSPRHKPLTGDTYAMTLCRTGAKGEWLPL